MDDIRNRTGECIRVSVRRALARAALAAFAISRTLPLSAQETAQEVRMKMDAPVVVAFSKPGERRWGFHQFPALARLPGGQIAATFSVSQDAVEAYGTPCPAFVSDDGGKTWTRLETPDFFAIKPHPSICEVIDGEFLYVPPAKPFDLRNAGLSLPEPIARTARGDGQVELFRFDDCPKQLQDYLRELDAWRWTPRTKTWKPEKVTYDTRGLLAWKRAKGRWATGTEAHLVPRTWFERAPVRVGNELIYADYRTKYELKGARIAPRWTSTCMVSKDKGKTWLRRGAIAIGTEKRPMAEPVIAPTSDGRLACAIRTAPGPLMITFSKDRGATWDPVEPVAPFGVFPGLLLLESKVLVLSYGRRGVHVKFSLDGTGKTWTEPTSLIPACGGWSELSCGYTSLLALGKSEFLIAYSDFRRKDAKGQWCKAILVRRIRVEPVR